LIVSTHRLDPIRKKKRRKRGWVAIEKQLIIVRMRRGDKKKSYVQR
jgi:hypothetical protein